VLSRIRVAVHPFDVGGILRGKDILLRHSGSERSDYSKAPAPELVNIELSALEYSSIKVWASPWTRVAGDGLVSNLVSSFFAYDNGFYLSFVDQECFLDDMKAGAVENAGFCSPLLVNAICALRCVSSSIFV
jgi:hypothetical protein